MADAVFAARIRERYPEGLTGIFAIGATRRTYILDQNRHAPNPGHIEDFAAHGAWLMERYFRFIGQFYGLGGQHMIITALSFRSFFERGPDYARVVVPEALRLIDEQAQAYYRAFEADPYFIGIDTLLTLPASSPVHEMAERFAEFQRSWPYASGRRTLIWEIASMPLLTLWQLFARLTPEERAAIDAEIAAAGELEALYHLLYRRFAREIYGTQVPVPHFYLGTNMSGDLKTRAPLPLALSGGDYLRLFYTPYPTLFMTEQAMKVMLADLAFGERFHSVKRDYDGRYTPELAQAEYERIMTLSADPQTTLGLARRVEIPALDEDA